jgi:hypothetical protein
MGDGEDEDGSGGESPGEVPSPPRGGGAGAMSADLLASYTPGVGGVGGGHLLASGRAMDTRLGHTGGIDFPPGARNTLLLVPPSSCARRGNTHTEGGVRR